MFPDSNLWNTDKNRSAFSQLHFVICFGRPLLFRGMTMILASMCCSNEKPQSPEVAQTDRNVWFRASGTEGTWMDTAQADGDGLDSIQATRASTRHPGIIPGKAIEANSPAGQPSPDTRPQPPAQRDPPWGHRTAGLGWFTARGWRAQAVGGARRRGRAVPRGSPPRARAAGLPALSGAECRARQRFPAPPAQSAERTLRPRGLGANVFTERPVAGRPVGHGQGRPLAVQLTSAALLARQRRRRAQRPNIWKTWIGQHGVSVLVFQSHKMKMSKWISF